MPWYWTDEMARVLVADGRIAEDTAATMIALPIAHRSEHDNIEAAVREILDDGEIPLAA